MANCPNCGSDHIQLKRETNVNWGRAVAGYALFGIVGGAVGAVTGEDRNVNACLDCGTSWNAQDLHKMKEIIKKLTFRKINLAIEEDRQYLNDFMTELGPYIDSISKAEEQATQIVKKAEKEGVDMTSNGCSYGCTTFLVVFMGGLFSGTEVGAGLLFGVSFVAMAIAWAYGKSQDVANSESVPQKIQVAKKEAEKLRRQAEIDFEYRVKDFVARHP